MAAGAPSIAVYTYSQTGQLDEVLSALLTPVEKAGARLTVVSVRPAAPYPFPWPVRRFFGIFPEAVDPAAAVPVTLDPPQRPAADLVVLGYQVWYLAPSIPVRSLLAAAPFAGADVLTVVACRNMWYSAALEVHRLLTEGGARSIGTVAAIDAAPAPATFVTTLRWLLLGRREAFWRFPKAGVSDSELARLERLGEALAAAIIGGEPVAAALAPLDPAPVDVPIAAADLIAGRAFRVWGRLVRARTAPAARGLLLTAFVGTLAGAIVAGLPVLAATALVARRPLAAAVRRRLAPALIGGGRR
ncbi:dialkylresorcinol condensing enzyme [Dactylosporangium vinaceum]|uniref:Dialkylrecorsinol condensing enzyme n=1 Tax=Dactylosporangium vinaceum TaxID=53362 RepID=A0ABV5M9W7_9ACTN|nr:hypothetical protein [Dactylosporangium vinaceum]UAB93151.1 dialkylresorcinol condensing enzyme [Dactylosporangium vinaceum]